LQVGVEALAPVLVVVLEEALEDFSLVLAMM
jgi:hypothetical protein